MRKNQKKQIIKSQKNAKKPAGNISFLKIRLCHMLGIAILHQCAKFHGKMSTTAQEIQEIPFFRQKSAVPAIFRKFRV